MDLVGLGESMDTKFISLKNNQGQSTIEYVLLMGVVLTYMLVVFRSNVFQSFLGTEGKFFVRYKAFVEFTYRYPVSGFVDPAPDYQLTHPGYFQGGDTRFFGLESKYPGNP